MKKILAILLAALIMVMPLCITAFAEGNKAEIEFSVGDDTLIINGVPVTVEKPYVVGVGVTLVPIRVITEAFGAKVDWEGETKTVTVAYPDVNIALRIGDVTAEVNGRAETLLAAPELTANGYTMIPLRFISENFGAVVSYDDATARIKVTLSDTQSGTTVSETITNKYVGDSYYGWSMENLSDFQIVERSFDGTDTYFDYDDDNWFSISISSQYEDYDFEKDFADTKSYFQGYTLVKADKDTSNSSKKSYRVQVRDKSEFIDIKTIATDKYVVTLFGDFENDKNDLKNEYLSKADTFDMVYEAEDIYDLSNVHDGYRKFTAENLNISFNVFADLIMVSDKNSENMFAFRKYAGGDSNTGISLAVYSKESVGGAEALAREDYNHNKKTVNESIAYYDTLQQRAYGDLEVYEYNDTINTAFYSIWDKDVFFEKGDYVYNIHFCFELPENDAEQLAASVLNSMEVSQIDSSKVGTLLRNTNEYTGTYKSSKINNCTLTVPNAYLENPVQNAVQYFNQQNGVVITGTYVYNEGGYSATQMRQMVKDLEDRNKNNADVKSVMKVQEDQINKNKAYKYIVSADLPDERLRIYNENYFILNSANGSIYVFSVEYPELAYSASAKKEVRDILETITFK